ncbi:Druantia anti-phage system protein DruA [Desulfoscipio gibsoniae]
MVYKTIPFRPRLEGVFRTRFYSVANNINMLTSSFELETLISEELRWVENECLYNIDQRRKYRAVWLLLRDLVRASWSACFRSGVLELSLPTLDLKIEGKASLADEKARLRAWLSESRLERLQTFEKFIAFMESEDSKGKRSVLTLVADGNELADRLQNAKHISNAVCPQLELVDEHARDTITGHRLADIWRYFRLTWATPSENTPGRTMQYLIRDNANVNRPVMGIISLENCAVQITDRDKYIGWNAREFIDNMKNRTSVDARHTIVKLLAYVQEGITGIDYNDICSAKLVNHPTDEVIAALLQEAANAEKRRQELLKDALDADEIPEDEKSELGSISKETETALYRRKRAEQLARLLGAKKDLSEIIADKDFDLKWTAFLDTEKGYSAVRNALVAQKSKHIGTSMLELNVCGALPPYNEILGGKLAALLALSPQIVYDYKTRYGQRQSDIASRLKGEAVVRPADLVYVGTTSLYFVGSSQYNRLKLPKKILDDEYEIKWTELGKTIGFGTLHIGRSTTAALVEAAENVGYTRINHVFGEGPSPKLRLINLSIRELLEVTPGEASELAKHAMSRIVYGAFIARNAKEYLLGLDEAPEYYFNTPLTQRVAEEKTLAIINYWSDRWLTSRIRYEQIFERLRNFDIASIRVSEQLREPVDWEFKRLEETAVENVVQTAQFGLDFVRSLYRGSSAYADNQEVDLLSGIHIVTSLDNAILTAIKVGKDVVLTGSPGDGKTHIIRILNDTLAGFNNPPKVELDASCLTNEQLYEEWRQSRESNQPFVLAINAAVLFSLAKQYPDFTPVVSATQQMANAVVFDNSISNSVGDEGIRVFDLSRREILHKDIVSRAVEKITSDSFYNECSSCNLRGTCPVHVNRKLIRDPLFQDRLDVLFARVSLKGQHVSLRELLSFLSFLLFGDRSCKQLASTAENNEYSLLSLIYKGGKGTVFEYIRDSFDPSTVSHPVIDEELLTAQLPGDSWSQPCFQSAEVIDSGNITLFELRKRQFFFFNKGGDILLDISDDDVAKYQRFIEQEDKACVKELIGKLNSFFGRRNKSEIEMWNGLRFNNSPRKMLISASKLKATHLSIGRPALIESMRDGIQTRVSYIRLQRKDTPSIFLKIDWELYCLLLDAERGVPMLLIKDNETTKRVWRFIEQLQQVEDLDDSGEIVLTMLDIDDKKELSVKIDREDKKYLSVKVHKIQL